MGASADSTKFSNKAIRAYLSRKYNVVPVNPNYKEILGIKCYPRLSDAPCKIDIISMYVPPGVGESMVNEIISINPKKIYLNPGAESVELINALRKAGINVILGCSITALGIDPNII